ncbi:hypothetical protein KYC5002_50095 [Archangium violaceum]|uniref:hypothetical protein n=1 Tax=Archangium violaceum TaxID=83451 RepID=UPI002B2BCCBC|nr:hypothetical protein KYC5002_50095 [Archangium gephyra]
MSETKIAIKVLTWPDLSFFKVHSMRSNQRAISLNHEIFIERFYPGLQRSHDQVLFPLLIVGPGVRPAHRLTRMAMRSLGSRNWHIKGESIHEPVEEPGRYGKLVENDFAIMAFEGNERPRAVTLTLVSAAEDAELHAVIAQHLELPAKHAMLKVSETFLAHLRASTTGAYPDRQHPLDAFISGDTIEDVLFGTDAPASTGTHAPSRTGILPPEDWHRLLLAADETRQRGEEFFGAWLTATGHVGDDFQWVSQALPRSAYDYEVHSARWIAGAPPVFVHVRATRASFERPIHMTLTELLFAAKRENCRIARLYDIESETPKLRILTGTQAIAERLIETLNALPDRVTADSLQLDPGLFAVELQVKLQKHP